MALRESQILYAPTIGQTNLHGVGGLTLKARGKVRDIYSLQKDGTDYLLFATTDRISAYDEVLPRAIPMKGQILTGASAYAFEQTKYIMPNHFVSSPHPNIMIVRKGKPVLVEGIYRRVFTGSAWRNYQKGKRLYFGTRLPGGLRENQVLRHPIFTPTTKAQVGHDVDLENHEQFVALFGGNEEFADMAVEAGYDLFEEGEVLAGSHGGYMADTKFEMGIVDGELTLIDEALTPDSSRYMFKGDYSRLYESNASAEDWDPYWKDKEVVRKWLARNHGWMGDGAMPSITDDVVLDAVDAYRDGYLIATGQTFVPRLTETGEDSIIQALDRDGWLR